MGRDQNQIFAMEAMKINKRSFYRIIVSAAVAVCVCQAFGQNVGTGDPVFTNPDTSAGPTPIIIETKPPYGTVSGATTNLASHSATISLGGSIPPMFGGCLVLTAHTGDATFVAVNKAMVSGATTLQAGVLYRVQNNQITSNGTCSFSGSSVTIQSNDITTNVGRTELYYSPDFINDDDELNAMESSSANIWEAVVSPGVATLNYLPVGPTPIYADDLKCPPAAGDPGHSSDFDHDGQNDDWDYNVDQGLPGTDIIVDLRGWHNGSEWDFIVVIGHDTNHNGRLDDNEITQWIGKCQYYQGQNKLFIHSNGHGGYYVGWVNKDPNTGEVTQYRYDTSTGTLTVWRNGVQIYQGPPSGWNFHTNLPV